MTLYSKTWIKKSPLERSNIDHIRQVVSKIKFGNDTTLNKNQVVPNRSDYTNKFYNPMSIVKLLDFTRIFFKHLTLTSVIWLNPLHFQTNGKCSNERFILGMFGKLENFPVPFIILTCVSCIINVGNVLSKIVMWKNWFCFCE